MAEWLYLAQLWVASGVGFVSLILGFARRKPSVLTIGAIALVELGLLIQLAFSISVVFLGERAKSDTVEYFAYLIVAMIVPVAAALWALVERTRFSTIILAIGAFTVAVMLVRMYQLWFGLN